MLCSPIELGLAPPRVVLNKKPVLRAHLDVGGGSMLTTLLTALPLTPTLAFSEEAILTKQHKGARWGSAGTDVWFPPWLPNTAFSLINQLCHFHTWMGSGGLSKHPLRLQWVAHTSALQALSEHKSLYPDKAAPRSLGLACTRDPLQGQALKKSPCCPAST